MGWTVGVVDEQPYPGPPEGSELLAWTDAMADIAGAVSSYYSAIYEGMREAFKPMVESFHAASDAMDSINDLVPPVVGAPRHGPRPRVTYDRRGRRRY